MDHSLWEQELCACRDVIPVERYRIGNGWKRLSGVHHTPAFTNHYRPDLTHLLCYLHHPHHNPSFPSQEFLV